MKMKFKLIAIAIVLISLTGCITYKAVGKFENYDEVFIGFGENVNENVFDQNRVAVLLGYKFSPSLRIEGGYLNQTVQLGREVNGRNVFQYNNGIILNTYLNANVIPVNFMVIGMAAVLSASIHAPFTAIFLVCGLTNDYTLFIPILAVCLISKYTAKLICPFTVYSYSPSLSK